MVDSTPGELHPLLVRQLRRVGLREGDAVFPPQSIATLLRHVSRAYVDADHDRYLTERSQDISSREMAALGAALRASEGRLATLEIERLARYDSLTGLPNRNTFIAEIERAVARARRDGTMAAVFVIDLDRFKTINDTLGHGGGDEVLRTVALRLGGVLREADMISRLGGDEFALLLEGCTDGAGLCQVAQRALATIAEPIEVGSQQVQISASLGISVFPTDGAVSDELVKHGEAAMYQAKSMGRNTFQFFTEELAQLSALKFELERELRLAVDRDELRLHFQPRFSVASGALIGMEALVRWQHPTRGLLHPGHFIELAEESGLIVPLGRWVIDAACRQLQDWRHRGLRAVPCAVNVSVRQFACASFVRELAESLRRFDVSPKLLEVEVTESLLMADAPAAVVVLEQIHALGVAIAIDDFGTGYSSLAYLKRFPADALKIDQSFVRDLPQSAEDAAIVRAVIAMAHSLKLQVVAEGVETVAQLEFLRANGCDEIQGYLLGRPMPAEQLAPLLGVAAPRGMATA